MAILGGGGGKGPWPGPRAFHAQKGASHFYPPPCICQNVQKYSVRCLKVVPCVPKMVLIRSKSKKYPPISSKAACKICPTVIPDGPKMARIGSKYKTFHPPPDSAPRPPAVLDVHTQGPAYKKWPRAPKFENRHCL